MFDARYRGVRASQGRGVHFDAAFAQIDDQRFGHAAECVHLELGAATAVERRVGDFDDQVRLGRGARSCSHYCDDLRFGAPPRESLVIHRDWNCGVSNQRLTPRGWQVRSSLRVLNGSCGIDVGRKIALNSAERVRVSNCLFERADRAITSVAIGRS